MFKGKRKINIVSFATFLLVVVAPFLIASRSPVSAWLLGEPQLPKKLQ